MKHDVGNKFPHQRVRFGAGIEKGHIQNENIGAELVGEKTPFLYDHLIVASQAVDGFNDEQISRL